ncbi:MAG: ATP-binding cassette domain-containing protein [Myxococcota bacterium]|nr:ATP-binding cassette domain-containing protein [Myxococcota bacterium]
MTTDIYKWQQSWAPYWSFLEDAYLTTRHLKMHLSSIKSPVLVLGALQGLIVEYLQEQGFLTYGVDPEKQMVLQAKKRRDLRLIRADAFFLPFRTDAYNTVIIAPGIIDYMSDETLAAATIAEASRVLHASGHLIVTLYQLSTRVEEIYRNIGVLTNDRRFQMKRIFDLFNKGMSDPLGCARLISGWTDKDSLSAFYHWIKLGLTMPAEMKREYNNIKAIVKAAQQDGISQDVLLESVPVSVPYRGRYEIEQILRNVNMDPFELRVGNRCMIAKCRDKARFTREDAALFSTVRYRQLGPFKRDLAIETIELTKKFQLLMRPAVDALTLRVPRGSIYGLLGPDGAGKTTTLSMLCGLTAPSSGRITFGSNTFGYVPQELAVYDELSGRDNIRFFASLYGLHGTSFEQREAALLELSGLAEYADDLVGKYSTGMKRRLNLALGLVHSPTVLLLDEPTAGVDPQSQHLIFDVVKGLNASGIIIVYATRYMEEALGLCDQVAIMDLGQLIIEGEPSDLIRSYGTYRIDFELDNQDRGPLKQSTLGWLEKIYGVRHVSSNASRLTFVVQKNRKRKDFLKELDVYCNAMEISAEFIGITEATMDSLFLDLTGRSLRDDIYRGTAV